MRLRNDFPYQELVKCTPGYVGADLQTLCKEASIIAVERVIRSTENGDSKPQIQEETKENQLDEENKQEENAE